VFNSRLISHPEVLSEAVKEGSSLLWLRLSQLFNALSLNNPAYEKDEEVLQIAKNIETTFFPEDAMLKGIKGLSGEAVLSVRQCGFSDMLEEVLYSCLLI